MLNAVESHMSNTQELTAAAMAVAEQDTRRRLELALTDLEALRDELTDGELEALEAETVDRFLGTLAALEVSPESAFEPEAWARFSRTVSVRARRNAVSALRRRARDARQQAVVIAGGVYGIDVSVVEDGDPESWAVRADLAAASLL